MHCSFKGWWFLDATVKTDESLGKRKKKKDIKKLLLRADEFDKNIYGIVPIFL